MIEHLGDLLRMSLDARHRQEIPLAEELAFLDHYVAIQKIRFAESLRLEIEVAPGSEVRAGALSDRAAAGGECHPPRHFAASVGRQGNRNGGPRGRAGGTAGNG